MFPFSQSGELSFQAAEDQEEQQANYQQDLGLGNELLAAVNLYASAAGTNTSSAAAVMAENPLPAPASGGSRSRGRGRARGRARRSQGEARSGGGGGGDGGGEDDDQRKMQHRDIERQRRQEMSGLFSNLRNLLPVEYLKGKRSMSDHIAESVNYIKHLEGNIKDLGDRRDQLRASRVDQSGGSHTQGEGSSSSGRTIPCNVEVYAVSTGLDIQISGCLVEDSFALSRALNVLLEAGLDIVSCVTNNHNGNFHHSIQCQAGSDMACMDVQLLQQRLYSAVCSS